MNEIEEYLLMIFLEENNRLNENIFGWHKLGTHVYQEEWNSFRFKELGRTIPEEFEFFVSDYGFHGIKGGGNMATFMSSKKNEHYKHKIKITVVEE